ncbi:MAG: YjgP/YjgQ family permease [Ignavibacteriae bacterium]|nr:MAG: YjgP/YjgQ family permease [Ignavibacteriota bacterium]
MFILWRHILRAHIGPFIFSVVLMMCIFLLQFLMKYLDQLTGKGLSAAVIAELITLNLAWMLVLAVPMGVLVATLMAFGGLASTNEITAMRASGVSLYRMIAPVIAASIIVCLLLISFNNDVLPDANHRTKVLTNDIQHKKPTLTLVPGMFIQLLQGHSILVRKTFEHSNDLEGVTIIDNSQPMLTSTITAHRGTISFSTDYHKLIMDLTDGEIHQVNNQFKNQYRIIRFRKHRIVMDAEGFNFQRSRETDISRGDREMSVQMMLHQVDSIKVLQANSERHLKELTGKRQEEILGGPKSIEPSAIYNIPLQGIKSDPSLQASVRSDLFLMNVYERSVRSYLVEIHKKFSIPVACIIFVLIGAPLGIMSRRGTFGMSASLSLGFFVFYWACLRGGENLADRGYFDPWIGMWIANIVLGIMGVYLTIRTARENPSLDLSWFVRWIPKSWRSDSPSTDKP